MTLSRLLSTFVKHLKLNYPCWLKSKIVIFQNKQFEQEERKKDRKKERKKGEKKQQKTKNLKYLSGCQ